MAALRRVAEVEYLGERNLRIVFSDGLVRVLDLKPLLRGLLSSIDDDCVFAQVSISSATGTLCWPGNIDLDPDVLRGDHEPASGEPVTVLKQYWLLDAG